MKRFDPGSISQSRFLRGRYGPDELGRFLSVLGVAAVILTILARLLGSGFFSAVFSLLAVLSVGWCYWRILSRNFARRQAENLAYRSARQRLGDWLCLQKDCFSQRKEYAFFRCPGCGRTVRVPKGKGRLRITCRHCGYTFEKKT